MTGGFETTNFVTFGTISLAIGGLSLAFGNIAGFLLLMLVGFAFYGVAFWSARKNRSSTQVESDKKAPRSKRKKK